MNIEQIEYKLMPIISRMEQRGINLNGEKLKQDYNDYFFHLDELDDAIYQTLGQEIDIDSNNELADALERSGKAGNGFGQTPGGKRSVAKDSLIGAITDGQLLGMLLVRGALATSVRTFIGPWHTQYQNHGRLYLKWNQFRNYTDTGARTGRLSSSPNLQNIPVDWEKLKSQLKTCGYTPPFDMPRIRQYLIPDPGKVFVGADYQAQEMRLLAHFAGGELLKSIQDNPRKDIHQIAADIAGITRTVAKTLGFAVLYGAGVGRIAESLNIPASTAANIKARYLAALPEIKRFTKECIDIGKAGGAIETLGGRRYKTDPNVKIINGRPVTFEYKLVNYKIQGSAADQTKLAMIEYDEKDCGELVLSVHDQLVAQEEEGSTPEAIQFAMQSAFADILKYTIVADPEWGWNFADMVSWPDAALPKQRDSIKDVLGAQDMNYGRPGS